MHDGKYSILALIPARAGSRRVPDKNIRTLEGHPLLAYTSAAARQSGIFNDVIVSTDSGHYARIADHYGAEVPFLRPAGLAGDLSPDIEWVSHAVETLREAGRCYDCFSILRPTSPFRLPQTIRRAWQAFLAEDGVGSLRAVEPCRQHPGKMWVVRGRRMSPLMPLTPAERPWHSSQYQSLPPVYVQNASLEIAWCRVLTENNSIAVDVLMPFLTQGHEGFDINSEYDWEYAGKLASSGRARLPGIEHFPYLLTEASNDAGNQAYP